MKIRQIFLDQLIAEGYDDTFASGYDAAYENMPCNRDWKEFSKGYDEAIEDMYKQIDPMYKI